MNNVKKLNRTKTLKWREYFFKFFYIFNLYLIFSINFFHSLINHNFSIYFYFFIICSNFIIIAKNTGWRDYDTSPHSCWLKHPLISWVLPTWIGTRLSPLSLWTPFNCPTYFFFVYPFFFHFILSRNFFFQ